MCLGAHCDDIEIGCGGTLIRLLDERPNVNVYWQVFASTPARKKEATEGANWLVIPLFRADSIR